MSTATRFTAHLLNRGTGQISPLDIGFAEADIEFEWAIFNGHHASEEAIAFMNALRDRGRVVSGPWFTTEVIGVGIHDMDDGFDPDVEGAYEDIVGEHTDAALGL